MAAVLHEASSNFFADASVSARNYAIFLLTAHAGNHQITACLQPVLFMKLCSVPQSLSQGAIVQSVTTQRSTAAFATRLHNQKF